MTTLSTIPPGDRLAAIERRTAEWLAANSRTILRLALGAVLLGFGLLKFFPGVSPAESLAVETFDRLTLGLLPDAASRLAVASFESVVGVLLLTGWLPRLTLGLLALQLIGILSPLVLLTGELFAGPFGAPTLAGQYVLKDVILVAAALVIAGDVLRSDARAGAR
jgi:uncharacterized membrane protein YkgB